MRRQLPIIRRKILQPMNMALPQRDREELLDLGRGTLDEVRRSLHDIRRINTYLGGARVVCDATWQLLNEATTTRHRPLRVLDVGTGSADIPLRLQREARRGLDLQIVALDLNARHLKIAREDLDAARAIRARSVAAREIVAKSGVAKGVAAKSVSASAIQLVQADGFRLPFRDGAFDVVVSSLFLHHFRAPQIVALLREFDRVSTRGWAMNDLVRHHVPLIFFRLTRPIFARSHITRHDGEASLRRGYTVREMRDIIMRQAQTDALFRSVQVGAHFPFRMSLVRKK